MLGIFAFLFLFVVLCCVVLRCNVLSYLALSRLEQTYSGRPLSKHDVLFALSHSVMIHCGFIPVDGAQAIMPLTDQNQGADQDHDTEQDQTKRHIKTKIKTKTRDQTPPVLRIRNKLTGEYPSLTYQLQDDRVTLTPALTLTETLTLTLPHDH